MIQLTKKERSVMDILWDSHIEMSASEIRETSNEELSITRSNKLCAIY